MSNIKKYLKEAKKLIKEKNFTRAITKLELVLMLEINNYQGNLLSIKCYMELKKNDEALKLITKLEENEDYKDDLNIKLAYITLLKADKGNEGLVIKKLIEIIMILIIKNDFVKILKFLEKIFFLISEKKIFEDLKEMIFGLIHEIGVNIENKEILEKINNFLLEKFENEEINNYEYFEFLEKYPKKFFVEEKILNFLKEKDIKKKENLLDTKKFKLYLYNLNFEDDINFLYKLKYGIFFFEEIFFWIEKFKKEKKFTLVEKKIIFILNYFEELINSSNLDFLINFDLEKIIFENIEENYFKFFFKLDDFFSLKKNFKAIISYFLSHLNICPNLNWLITILLLKLKNYVKFVENNNSYINKIFEIFFEIENENFKIWIFSIAKYFNYIIKPDFIKIEKIDFENFFLKNIFFENFENLKISEILDFKKKLSKNNLFYITINYYLDSLLLKMYLITNEISEIKNLLKNEKNFFLEKERIKIFAILEKKKIFENLKNLEKKKIYDFLLRDEDIFKLTYFFIISKKNLKTKIFFFSEKFNYYQNKIWYLNILSDLLLKLQDFGNCFNLLRNIYDILNDYIFDEKNFQKKKIFEKSILKFSKKNFCCYNVFIEEKDFLEISEFFDKKFLFSNKKFYFQILRKLVLVSNFIEKFNFSLKIIEKIEKKKIGDFVIKKNFLLTNEAKMSFFEFLKNFGMKDFEKDENFFYGVLLIKINIFSKLGDFNKIYILLKKIPFDENLIFSLEFFEIIFF